MSKIYYFNPVLWIYASTDVPQDSKEFDLVINIRKKAEISVCFLVLESTIRFIDELELHLLLRYRNCTTIDIDELHLIFGHFSSMVGLSFLEMK